MKKLILRVIRCFALGMILSPHAFSVVPASVSLDEAGGLRQDSVAASTSPRSVSQVADKLAEDQRHLEKVLQDLKEDQKALKQASHQEK